jgi:phage-related protein
VWADGLCRTAPGLIGRFQPTFHVVRQNPGVGIMYVTVKGRRVVIVRVFVKKTQKTPRREIEVALARAREVLK